MKIAVIGGGVAGLHAACRLDARHEVVLIEREPRIGGHTDTHHVDSPHGPLAIDTGFIVFNRRHYPLFSAWLDELGVESRISDMSFGISCERSGLEYNATSLNTLFSRRSNLIRPRFLGMVRDILRFYRDAPDLLETLDETVTLGQWLTRAGYGEAFGRDHLVPMAAALWSSPDNKILEFPMRYLLEFMRNHDMLQVDGRPQWRTVTGGSRRYVDAALQRFSGRLHTGRAVCSVRRLGSGRVEIATDNGAIVADHAVLACHADQALSLIEGPRIEETEVLGAFKYQSNETVLHTDASRMPHRQRAWAAWNVRRDRDRPDVAGISYWMNALQGLPGSTSYIVSLNQTGHIDPDRILVRRRYRHPIYTPASRAAQRRLAGINGRDRLWFCGACWGFGFHEDAVRSACTVVDRLNDGQEALRVA